MARDYNQSNSATIYNDWARQTQNGHKNKFFIIARLKAKGKHFSGIPTRDPALHKQDLVLHLRQVTLLLSFFWRVAPWYCGQEVGTLRDPEAVAFFVARLAPDQQPEKKL